MSDIYIEYVADEGRVTASIPDRMSYEDLSDVLARVLAALLVSMVARAPDRGAASVFRTLGAVCRGAAGYAGGVGVTGSLGGEPEINGWDDNCPWGGRLRDHG